MRFIHVSAIISCLILLYMHVLRTSMMHLIDLKILQVQSKKEEIELSTAELATLISPSKMSKLLKRYKLDITPVTTSSFIEQD